ncbi:MAG: hypothetical protein MI810_00260, partial [Flavobacteriales bacterium]|nr:hypothetical protein [Flavobacteriales bacterium]
KFNDWKKFRRNVYIYTTLNGAIVNWYFFFQPLILVSFTGIFIVVLSNTVQVNGRRIFNLGTETFEKAEIDLEWILQMTSVCVFSIVLAYSVPKFLSMIINESAKNRQKRQQFLNLMQRNLRYDPFADMHEMEYNSNVDPVSGYLWFLYYDFALRLTEDFIKDFQRKERSNDIELSKLYNGPMVHPIDCDCALLPGADADLGKLAGYGYEGVLQCYQKIDVVKRTVQVLRAEFPKKHQQYDEDELMENLCIMGIECYNRFLGVIERGACSTMTSCITRFSIQPPRGAGAYAKNN